MSAEEDIIYYEDTIIKNCPEQIETLIAQIEEQYENWLGKLETNIKNNFSEDEIKGNQEEYSTIFDRITILNENIESIMKIGDDHIEIIEKLEGNRLEIDTTINYSNNLIAEVTTSREVLKSLEVFSEEELVELENKILITQLDEYIEKIDDIKNSSENGESLETLQTILDGLNTKYEEFEVDYNDKYKELADSKLDFFWNSLYEKFYEEVPNRVYKILINIESLFESQESEENSDIQKEKKNFLPLKEEYNEYVESLNDIKESSDVYYENSEFDKELFEDWLKRVKNISKIKDSFINLLTKHIPPETLEIFEKIINTLEENRGRQRRNTFEKTFNELIAMEIFTDVEQIKKVCYELSDLGLIDIKFIFTLR